MDTVENLSKYLIHMVVEWQVNEHMITPNDARDTREELRNIITQYQKEQEDE